MKTRQIADFTSSAIGLGAMPMSIEGRPDRAQALRTIHAALLSYRSRIAKCYMRRSIAT